MDYQKSNKMPKTKENVTEEPRATYVPQILRSFHLSAQRPNWPNSNMVMPTRTHPYRFVLLCLLLPLAPTYIYATSSPLSLVHFLFLYLKFPENKAHKRHRFAICITSMLNECDRALAFGRKFKLTVCCFSGIDVDARHEMQQNGELQYKKLQSSKTPNASWLKRSDPIESGCTTPSRDRSFMSRIGRKHNRYSRSADFSYDPSSYALNFEDESRMDDYEFPSRDFASRLMASPPPSSSAK